MQPCKSDYDYEQLVTNYIEYNINSNIEYNNGEPLPDKFTSTAQRRLSFDGPYLISYNTRVAKFVHTKRATYLLIDINSYSNTTTKQLRTLQQIVLNGIYTVTKGVIIIETTDIDNSFNAVKDYYFERITDTYKYCKKARVSRPLQAALEAYKSFIQSILPELHYKTREATLRKLQELPNIPDKLDKFTRPILLSVLESKGLI